ncbi:hypothetical protein ACOTZF_24475 [Enterobacter cloacae complex sp. SHL021]|uniref:hypothetical protein n=1 Tax=Enterobacter cloacae complex sp. SHL021 TaxID=3412402 RepID=UPI003B9B1E5D
MSAITKQWLQQKIADMEAARDEIPFGLDEDDSNTLAAMKLALASLEAEPVVSHLGSKNALDAIVAFIKSNRNPTLKDYNEVSERLFQDNCHGLSNHVIEYIKQIGEELEELRSTQDTVPPAPVAVPECFKRLLHHAYGMTMGHDWNKGTMAGHHRTKLCQAVEECRAAMLQGADGTLTNEGTIPVTQFKPVADLYGLTSPTGGETSFTFDAVEARDFIDGGWSCQEYVELERFQEAITNHTEDKLAMVDHSGDSNNMVEPVTTAYKLPPHVYRELVNSLRDTAVKYQGCQQLREQLSRTLQEVIQPTAPQQEETEKPKK